MRKKYQIEKLEKTAEALEKLNHILVFLHDEFKRADARYMIQRCDNRKWIDTSYYANTLKIAKKRFSLLKEHGTFNSMRIVQRNQTKLIQYKR